MLVSVVEAARLVGRDRKTLYRDIKNGKLSATKDRSGLTKIDRAELIRAYGELCGVSYETQETVLEPQQETSTAALLELERLRTENAALRGQIESQAANLNDLRNAIRLLEYRSESGSLAKKPGRWWKFWK